MVNGTFTNDPFLLVTKTLQMCDFAKMGGYARSHRRVEQKLGLRGRAVAFISCTRYFVFQCTCWMVCLSVYQFDPSVRPFLEVTGAIGWTRHHAGPDGVGSPTLVPLLFHLTSHLVGAQLLHVHPLHSHEGGRTLLVVCHKQS